MVVIGGNELIVVLKNVVSLVVKAVGMFLWRREIVKFV